MLETLQALAGFALIAALFIAYARERRAKSRPPPPPSLSIVATAVTEPASDSRDEPKVGDRAVQHGSSPNWGMPIVFCLLLAGAASHRGSAWGYLWQGLYLAIVAYATYSTLSSTELAAEQMRRPGTTRVVQYVKLGVPYVVIPIVAWILAIPMAWSPGVILPALPWVLLMIAGLIALILERVRRPKRD